MKAGRPITPFTRITASIRTNTCKLITMGLIPFLLLGCQSVEPGAPDMTYGWGPKPLLKPPAPQIIPLVRPAKAVGWQPGESPTPAEGLAVNAFAQGLDHPRWLYELPNGDILEFIQPSRVV